MASIGRESSSTAWPSVIVQEVDRRGRVLRRGEIMPEIVDRQFPGRVFQKEDQIGDRPHAGLGKGALTPAPVEAVRKIVHETAQMAVGDALIDGRGSASPARP